MTGCYSNEGEAAFPGELWSSSSSLTRAQEDGLCSCHDFHTIPLIYTWSEDAGKGTRTAVNISVRGGVSKEKQTG